MMKRKIFEYGMFFCFTVLLMSNASCGENIVPNPGFEDSGKTEEKAKAWPGGGYIRDNTSAYSGTYSIKISRTLKDAISDRFILEGRTKYTLSCWHKDTRGSNGIYIQQFDADGKLVATNYWYGSFSSDWKQESYTFITHKDAVHGRIILRANTEEPSWVDLVELLKTDGQIPIQDVTYRYSIQPNDGKGDPEHIILTDGIIDGQWGVNWAGGIIKNGMDIDFDLHGRYQIEKVILYTDPKIYGYMDDPELYISDNDDFQLAGVAMGYKGAKQSTDIKLATFEDIDMPAQKIRLKVKGPLHVRILEVEIYGKKAAAECAGN